MKVSVITLGCKVNQYESQAMLDQLVRAGFSACESAAESDIVLINSCTVTSTSDHKVRQTLHRARRGNPSAVIVLTGCMPQAFPELVEQLTDADIVDPVHGIAFAVYSEDDHSLMFYKRRGVPRVGDMLNSRRVTAVYTGFENGYATATVGNDGKTTAPWWPNRNNIVAVKAIDDGIEIHSLAFCFQYMENCKSFDLAKFDMSNCTNLQHAFAYCGNATSFSISSWDTSSVVEFDSALKNLYKVEEIDISGWSTRKAGDLRLLFSTDSSLKSVKFGPGWKTSDVMDILGMFSYCKNLNLDCSDWNVPTYANHSDFNHCAPGVILPKAWQ